MFKPHRMRGNAVKYFTHLGVDDYFTKGCDQPGTFHGSGLEDVGLKEGEQVTEETFCNSFEGYTPDGKEKLVQNAGDPERENGMDGVFTLPTDLSIAYARMTPEERAVVEAKAVEKVKEVMDHFEKTYATSRIGRGGEDRLKAKLIYAVFQHITARTQDSDVPDMHVHWH